MQIKVIKSSPFNAGKVAKLGKCGRKVADFEKSCKQVVGCCKSCCDTDFDVLVLIVAVSQNPGGVWVRGLVIFSASTGSKQVVVFLSCARIGDKMKKTRQKCTGEAAAQYLCARL